MVSLKRKNKAHNKTERIREQNEKQKTSVHFSRYVCGLGWSTNVKIAWKNIVIDLLVEGTKFFRRPIPDIEPKQKVLLLPPMNPNQPYQAVILGRPANT